MSLILPYGMNSALKNRASPFADLARGQNGQSMKKLERIVARGEPSAREKAATVGNMLMSGQLRAGSGPNGNAALQKAAATRRYPIMSDDPEKSRLNKAVGAALANLQGNAPVSFTSGGDPALQRRRGVGAGVRAMKAAGDRNLPMLPGTQGPMIDETAIEIMNTLPDARVRQGVISALMMRPPANANDGYKWCQSIVALRDQISEMCEEMGLDPTALTDLLDRRVSFYDPMAQTAPATVTPQKTNLSDFDDPEAWPAELKPPVEPIDSGRHPDTGQFRPSFEGTTRTDLNPDFGTEEKLAKFFDYAKRGVDIRKGPMGKREYEAYGLAVVKAEFDGDLQKQMLLMHDTKKRVSPAAWSKITREKNFNAMLRRVEQHPFITRAMRGAAIALFA
jgi:hypothetical protein